MKALAIRYHLTHMSYRSWKGALRQAVQKVTRLDIRPHVPLEREYGDMDQAFFPLYRACSAFTMTSIERMYAMYEAVAYLQTQKIPGDIVECGVWRGGSSMLAAKQLASQGDTTRHFYLYDTFTGMPKPSSADVNHDGEQLNSDWNKQNKAAHNEWCYASLEDVKANMQASSYPGEKVHYVQGKVEETIPATMPGQIALLRLDTDWYESTKHELVHLFPLLAPGGVLIIDDYGRWRGSRDAVNEYFPRHTIMLSRIDSTGRLYVKP